MTEKLAIGKNWIVAFVTGWILSFPCVAQDPSPFPFREWTEPEVTWMLSQSPWAGRVRVETPQGSCRYTARLFSAVPIRLALARHLQLLEESSRGSRSDGNAAERMFQAARQEYPDRIVVSLTFDCENFEDLQRVHQILQNQSRSSLQNSVFLQPEGSGNVQITDYGPPDPDGSGAKFVFPRERNQRPLMSTDDRRLGFRFLVPGTDQQIQHYWSVPSMIVDGELVY